ncbi:MAG: hypothetical protein WCQ95_01390 [Bacteroidota bacterium]
MVLPEQWDDKKKFIKSNHPQPKALNTQIQALMNSFESLQAEAVFKKKPFTIDDCKKALAKDNENPSFLDFMEQEINTSKILSKRPRPVI